MAGRKILIEFIGKDSGSGRVASDLEQKFGKLGARMNKVGQVSGRVLAGGLVLAAGAAVKAGQAAAEDEQAQVKLANTLRQTAGATTAQVAATEDWIAAQGKALGVADDELRPALARLATATGDVGKAQKLASLAMDISAATGKDLSTVSTALAKAQTQGVSSLSRLGVATKNAAGETMSLSEVTDSLTSKYSGSAAKAAKTTAGQQKILTVQMQELQEEIGTKLLPTLTSLSSAGLKTVDWMSNNSTTVKILVGSIAGLLAITWATTKAIAAWTAITKIAAAAQVVFTNIQWALNVAMAANPIGLVIVAIAALAVGLVVAYKKSETFRNIVNGAFGAVAKAAKAAVDFIRNNWQKIFVILTGPVGLAVLAIARNWDKVKAGASAVVGAVRTIWRVVTEALTAPIRAAVDVIRNNWDRIETGFRAVRDTISTVVSGIKTTLGNAFDAMLRPIQAVIDKIQWLIDKIKSIPTPNLPNIPGLRTGATSTSSGVRSPSILPVKSSPVAARATSSGGTVSAVVQFVLPDGKVIEQQLIQWSRDSGRPLQVSTI